MNEYEYLIHARSVVSHCKENAEEWKIDTDQLAKLEVAQKKAEQAYRENQMRSTRNMITNRAKNEAFKELKALMRPFTNCLVKNLNVPDIILSLLSIRSRTPKKLPVHSIKEMGRVLFKRDGTDIKTKLVRQSRGRSVKSNYPKGATGGTEWEYGIKGSGKTETVRSTRLTYVFHFSKADAGQTLVVRARWINAKRANDGYWSAWIEIIIT
jgi:hypothetical protein